MSVVVLLEELAANRIELRLEAGALRYRAPEGMLTAELRERITSHREQLIAHLSGRSLAEPAIQRIAPTAAQKRLWFVHELQGPNHTYNIPFALRLRGHLEVSALRGAVEAIVQRHQLLRAAFHFAAGELELEVHAAVSLPWVEVDFSGETEPARSRHLERLAAEFSRHAFDLAQAPLLRVTLVKTTASEHLLLLNVHHIVADGWSFSILQKELAAGYEAACAGRPATFSPLAWQYSDYSAWQQWLEQRGAMEADLRFWRERLVGAPPSTSLPPDFARPEVQAFTGATTAWQLDFATTARLRAKAREWGASLNHVTLAATAVLLSQETGARDLVIGLPLANRTRRELEPIIGMFVNVVPLRLTLPGNVTAAELVEIVKHATTEALAHGNLPFERLIDAVAPARDVAVSPIFQVVYNFLPAVDARSSFGGLEVDLPPLNEAGGISKYDCTFYLEEVDGTIVGRIEYSDRLYQSATAERWARALAQICQRLAEGVALSPTAIPTPHAQAPADAVFTGPVVPLPSASPWQQFETVAQQAGDRVAVEENERTTTYTELLRRAALISAYLAKRGVVRGSRVLLILPRGADYLAALLGVLRCGAVFVPIDQSQPSERIRRLAERVRPSAVICRPGDLAAAAAAPVAVVVDAAMWLEARPVPPAVIIGPEDPVYMIFTSGSTGKPKAACLPWRGLGNVTQAIVRLGELRSGERVSQIASIGFDASLYEIWPALTTGATLVIVPEEARFDAEYLRDWIVAKAITFHFSPTPLAEQLLALPWPERTSLRILATGGQRLHRRPSADTRFRVLNCYGPTEASIAVTSGFVAAEPAHELPPLGVLIDNLRAAVVDQSGTPVAAGTVGELVVAGPGVGLGYFEDPVATARVFVSLPELGAGLWYRTGDQVRRRPDGQLDYLGRVDGQIKLRGNRIEVGEIESELLRIDGVRQAVVRLERDQLAAYVEAHDGTVVAAELRRQLARTLPPYMVPTRLVVMDALPRLPSGKIDLAGIAAGDPTPVPEAETPASTAPSTELVAGVTRAWSAVLKAAAPRPEDNFFDAGGHSLMLVELRDAIRRETGRSVRVVDLFRHPTIARQAAFLESGVPASAVPAVSAAGIANRDIAIIGMAGRFPGADDVEQFWENLRQGRDTLAHFSRDELVQAGVPLELADAPDYVAANGTIRDHDCFDADFFGIPPGQAELLDPQQRLLLEEAWHAFEDAGYDPARIVGRVGVFVGSSLNGYLIENVLPNRRVLESFGGFAVSIHNDKDFAATRISYKLGLTGPSLSVNTACSTSLVAIHQAVTALRDGQCELALAGGSCVRSRQVDGYRYEPGGVLSRDGTCRTFDAAATGMVGGSGVALVLLKPLAAALADRDPIYAVIKGIAVNNDGADKVGFTAPGVNGQSAVVRDALQRAAVDPETVRYVEAHGTATQLGDTIEVAALAQNYAPTGHRLSPLFLGSVKTNVGHLDAAAGAAGLIKTALCLRERTLVPSLYFETPNPHIDWPGAHFVVSTRTAPLIPTDAPLRAAVSSLGIGGTNAHAILEEAPAVEARTGTPNAGEPYLFLFSGQTEAAARANARAVVKWIARHPQAPLADVAHTLAQGRRHWPQRCAMAAATRDELATAVAELPPTVAPATSVALLFTGMGLHRPGTLRALYRRSSVFRQVVDDCAGLLQPELGLDIRTALLANPDDAAAAAVLDTHRSGQPALFVVSYALARFWQDLGVKPTVLVGHSLGEWVAACLAGVFALNDALRLVALRGGLMDAQPKGAMLAVNLTPAEVEARVPAGLDIATINAPDQVVVSGPAGLIESFAVELERAQVRCKRLPVAVAAHSSLMEPALEPLRAAIAAVVRKPVESGLRVLSNTTGEFLAAERLQDPDYWTAHLRHGVRFSDNIGVLCREPGLALLECGPSHTLCNLVLRDPRRSDDRVVVASCDAAENPELEWQRTLASAGTLWCAGVPVDLAKLAGLQPPGRRISLPGYVFQRQRYWLPAASLPGVEPAPVAPAPAESVQTTAPSSNGASPEEHRVIDVMRELLGPVHLARHSDFFLAGGDSLLAVRLAARLGDVFGVQPSRADVIKARTPVRIAALMDGRVGSNGAAKAPNGNGPSAAEPDGCVVRLSRGDERLAPIVLIHAIGGGAFIYRELLESLAHPYPAYGLQAPGLWDDAAPLSSVRAQAELYYASLLRAGVQRPVLVGGCSYGGLVAYELDRLYRAAGHAPVVALFDSPGPGRMPERLDGEAAICAYLLSGDSRNGEYEAQVAELRRLDRPGRVARLRDRLRQTHLPQASNDDVERLLRVFRQNLDNLWNWTPAVHDTRLVFFKATEQARQVARNPELAWIPLAPLGIEILPVPGDHSSMLSRPHVRRIAAELDRILPPPRRADARITHERVSLTL